MTASETYRGVFHGALNPLILINLRLDYGRLLISTAFREILEGDPYLSTNIYLMKYSSEFW